MFWIVILLIVFMIGCPKQMISIIAFLSCFILMFWTGESLFADPVSFLLQLIVGFGVIIMSMAIWENFVNLMEEKKKEGNDNEDGDFD